MAKERLYLVTYDISDPKRWRKVFGTMNASATGFNYPSSSADWPPGEGPR